jgi:hypothetical protein
VGQPGGPEVTFQLQREQGRVTERHADEQPGAFRRQAGQRPLARRVPHQLADPQPRARWRRPLLDHGVPEHDRWLPPQRVGPPGPAHRRPNPQPVPHRQPTLVTVREGTAGGPGPGGGGAGTAGRARRGEAASGKDHAGAFAGAVAAAGQVDPGDREHDPLAAEAEPLGLLGHRGGNLDPTRLPDPARVVDPAEQDGVTDRRRPHRGGGGARRQQGGEDERAGQGGGAPVPEAGRAGPQAGHGQGGGHDHPGRRRREPGPQEHPGGGGRRQRDPVHVGVRVGMADGTGRPAWPHATVTRSLSWS